MTFRGVLARRTSDLTAQDLTGGGLAIPFQGIVYDTDSAWSAGSPTQLTIPSAWNGKRGIINIFDYYDALSGINAGTTLQLNKGGSFFATTYGLLNSPINNAGNGQGANQAWVQGNTFAMPLTTGDVWTNQAVITVDTSVTVKAGTSMSIVVLDEFAPAYVLAKLAGDFTGDFSTPAVINWDGADIYDTNSIHSPSVNNSKLIIPAALNNTYVIARCNLALSNVNGTTALDLAIRKNGSIDPSVFTGFTGQGTLSGSPLTPGVGIGVQSHPFQVVTGDTVEALLYCPDTSITVNAAGSSFGLFVVGR